MEGILKYIESIYYIVRLSFIIFTNTYRIRQYKLKKSLQHTKIIYNQIKLIIWVLHYFLFILAS